MVVSAGAIATRRAATGQARFMTVPAPSFWCERAPGTGEAGDDRRPDRRSGRPCALLRDRSEPLKDVRSDAAVRAEGGGAGPARSTTTRGGTGPRDHDDGTATARPAIDHPSAESTRGPSFRISNYASGPPHGGPLLCTTLQVERRSCTVPALLRPPRVLRIRASSVTVSRAYDLPRAGRRAGPTCPPATYIAARSA